MVIDFYNGILYDLFFKLLYDFYSSLSSLDLFMNEEFALQLGQDFIAEAIANYGIALYFLLYFLVGFLIYKLVSFLFTLFFRR